MATTCSFLLKPSHLTDTRNKLLESDTNYKNKFSSAATKRKFPLIHSFDLEMKNLTENKFLVKQDLKNKFLKTDNTINDDDYSDIDVFYKRKPSRKAKMRAPAWEIACESEIEREREAIGENLMAVCNAPAHEMVSFGGFSAADFSEGMDGFSFGKSAPMSFPPPSGAAPSSVFFGSTSSHCLQRTMMRSAKKRSNAFTFGDVTLDSDVLTCSVMSEMPAYHFPPLAMKKVKEAEYKSLEQDSEHLLKKHLKELQRKKMCFLNLVSTSLLHSPQFKKVDDPFRACLLKFAQEVVSFDPEFILKVALYARQELNIRSTANFLLAFAAYESSCRLFLKKYFESSICLPTDWMDVAEMYLVLDQSANKSRSLPAALRKVLKTSFAKFDTYQLAKYNKSKKKKPGKKQKDSEENSDVEMKEVNMTYTLKQLIRLLHLSSPVNEVMCILGKKYPEDPEAFRRVGLQGTWNSSMAGKRMKLPIPETWETMISSKGNKAEVWESLIDNRKLPYMATLRNLRNMILAGMSKKHHEKVQKYLSRKESVVKSRQFPLRFYAAFKVLERIEECVSNVEGMDVFRKPAWKSAQKKALQSKVAKVDLNILERYKKSLSDALEISANHNLDPIGGRTVVISDLTDNFSEASGGAADYFNKKFHSCILLSLMCLKACEECEVKAILSKDSVESIQLKSALFLENMSELCKNYEHSANEKDNVNILCKQLSRIFEDYLITKTMLHQKLNNVIFLKTNRHSSDNEKSIISNFLLKYRQLVNPRLLYIQVDLSADTTRLEDLPTMSDDNNIHLSGFSEQIFKFIAERSNGGQLAYVENIDKKYDLMKKHMVAYGEQCPKKNLPTLGLKIPIYSNITKWETARIFISSTFKDMHSERDLLLRYVFPELKARAASIFVKINEIDLRWGISEAASMSSRNHELCLLEAQNSDFFIGMLGERYGTRFNFESTVDPKLSWAKEYPGSSITELEMHCGALNRESRRNKAFFFIRSSGFISRVPLQWREHFEAEESDSHARLEALKDKIRKSGAEVYDQYPCHFAGVYEEKPVVAGLDKFGRQVLSSLWNALCKFYKKDNTTDEVSEGETCHQNLESSHSFFIGEQNSPLSWVMKELKIRSGIFAVTGRPGSGKTAFIVRVLKEIKSGVVVPYFIGSSSQTTDLSYMLCYIANSILSKLSVSISVPRTKESLLNNFPDIIIEGSKASYPGNLLLIIDGLDYLDTEAQSLDWLPHDLPSGFKLICSVSESSVAYKALQKREKNNGPVHFVPLKPLLLADRQLLVRQYLQQHGKALDENPFNNQMLQLVTKMDSGNPLYLRVACDYFITFAIFENLMQKLKTFPPMLGQVLEEIINQMEKSHSAFIVQNALSLMCIVKEGLEEKEMHVLLSIANPENFRNSLPEFSELVSEIIAVKHIDLMPHIEFCSLVHMLKRFAYPFGNLSHASLSLASKDFVSIVKKYYTRNGFAEKLPYFHRLLAAYYMSICDPRGNQDWNASSTPAFGGLLHHLHYGKCYAELVKLLCSHGFLEAAFYANVGEELPQYYEMMLSGQMMKLSATEKNRIQDYRSFNNQNIHVLKVFPFLVHQQALNEPVDSCAFKEVTSPKGLTLECVTRSATLNCRLKTLDGFAKEITCVKIHDLNETAALGSEDGSVKLLNTSTGKIVSSLRGHSSTITSLFFLGRDKICVSSGDCTLSIWSCSEHYRIAVLEGHQRFISSCCSDPQGNIVSAGWDCTVRFWSSQDGRQISIINEIRSPVNSVAHHPEQQVIACGLWNKTIQIWDAILLEKKWTLQGHRGSVRSVVYSPNGLYILSSSLQAEVFIWSANECLKIAKLDGHTSSVNHISCSTSKSYSVTASDDTTLKVWPDEQQAVKMTFSDYKTHPVNFMEIVSHVHLAVAFQNSIVRVLDLVDGKIVTELDTKTDQVCCFSKFHASTVKQQNMSMDRSVEILVFGTKSGKAKELKFENASVTEVGCLNSPITAMLHTESLVFCGTVNGDIALLSFNNAISPCIQYGVHQNSVSALSVSAVDMSGHMLSASTDMTVKMWEFKQLDGNGNLTLNLVKEQRSKHKDYVTSCCLYPSSTSPGAKHTMVTGSYDNTVIVWDDKNELVLTGLKTSVSGIFYNGKYIIACGSDGSTVVWSRNGKCVSNIPGIEKSSAVTAFHFQKEIKNIKDFDAILAFVENDGSISIKRPFQRSSLCTLCGHGEGVTSCDINRNNVILSCSLDKTVNLWKVPVMKDKFCVYHTGKIISLAVSHSGKLAFSGDDCGNLILWCIGEQHEKHPLKYVAQKKYAGGCITAIVWKQDNQAACAVQLQSQAGTKHYMETLNCKPTSESNQSSFLIEMQNRKDFSSEITSMCFCAAFHTVIVGLKSGHIFLMNSQLQKEIKVADDWILKINVTPMPHLILQVATVDGTVKCFALAAMLKLQSEQKDQNINLCKDGNVPWVTGMVWGSSNKTLYAGSTSGQIFMCSSSFKTVKQAHMGPVSDMCNLGSYLFTASSDKTVKVWDMDNLKQVGQFHSQTPISCLAASPQLISDRSKPLPLIFGTIVGDVHLLMCSNSLKILAPIFGHHQQL